MSKRLSGCQALSLLNQLADDESGDTDGGGEMEENISSDMDWKNSISLASDDEEDSHGVNSDVDDATAPNTAVTFQRGVGVETDTQQGGVDRGGIGHGGIGRGGRGRGGRGRGGGVGGDAQTQNPMSQNTARDGTVWRSIDAGTPAVGRVLQQNIIKEISGPTPHAKRHISDNQVESTFKHLVDETMLRHIVHSTEAEARYQLGDESWTMSCDELDAFIAILYARGAYASNGLCIKDLWNKIWGPPFFTQTISRNRFYEIMRFLRFDIKSTRSLRLATDQFALA